jgi:protein-tyrosine-phosphatase
MAEGFARAYGRDLWEAESAGLAPATLIAPLTRHVMDEKDISLAEHFPKGLDEVKLSEFDLLVNMSGFELPDVFTAAVREWQVPDPIGQTAKTYRKVRDQVESLVLELREEVRGRRREESHQI